MAMPKKGHRWRPITVDGTRYRWLISTTWDDEGKVMLHVVVGDEYKGFMIATSVTYSRDIYFSGLAQFSERITPILVAEYILLVVAQGWKPEARGMTLIDAIKAPSASQ